MEIKNYYKMYMESGAVYTYNDGIVRIEPSDEPIYSIKAWQFFAFDPEEIEEWDGLTKFMDTVKKKEPAVGRRVLVYGKDDWRISTRIVKLETEDV